MSTLLAVFAHPDDETFICGGTLAKYAREGHRVVLVCATKGEMGRRMGVPPTATRETIPSVRHLELTNACQVLGVASLNFLGLRDKTLEIQPKDRLTDSVMQWMEKEQPDAVITFHEKLGGHPDHCAIGVATTAAFIRYKEQQPRARLYFVAWARMMKHFQDYGVAEDQFVQIDVSRDLPAKLQAFRAHRTQSEMNQWLWKDEQTSMSKLASIEYFLQYERPFEKGVASLFA